MKIGNLIHWTPSSDFKKRGWVEFDGKILVDCSYLGDGKRKIWGISKKKSYNQPGYLAVDEEELSILEV